MRRLSFVNELRHEGYKRRKIGAANSRSGKVPSGDFYNQPIAKLPFFAFFVITKDFIAARGRGSGLALWIRE
ncbi:hypothetical protein NIES2100_73640 [Calothrix sp. NIES-2100]|uniref:hypothetical protein n=1 Tax=Calothrix sp. NIES-2100 TaxID=1954172 RepID=UPI000B5EA848|nr:hypothetical protein NIES2100_73640 [Calothrix sp. NIES-2100]